MNPSGGTKHGRQVKVRSRSGASDGPTNGTCNCRNGDLGSEFIGHLHRCHMDGRTACTRRSFLAGTISLPGLVALGTAHWPLLPRLAAALSSQQEPIGSEKILIVLQLTGGNDGLNTVVPYEDDVYARSRPTLRLTARQVLRLPGEQLGFHPELVNFLRLYEQGYLTIVQGVGYPNASREHARAMLNWQTAKPTDPQCPTGWIGRALDQLCQPDKPTLLGALVAAIPRPHALNATEAVSAQIRAVRDLIIRPHAAKPGGQNDHTQQLELLAAGRSNNELLDYIREATVQACQTSRRVREVMQISKERASSYPDFPFARRLRTVADLIRADLGIRVIFTEHGGGGFGGFDNHANQAANHGALLRQLGDALAAFVADLKRDGLLERVLLMTFSEFGRTVAENGRRGTDHGVGAPMFLLGSKLRPGLIGQHPDLSKAEDNAVPFHTDFRSVYATVLDRWLEVDSRLVLGGRFPHVPIFA